jgi:hypothetical protein
VIGTSFDVVVTTNTEVTVNGWDISLSFKSDSVVITVDMVDVVFFEVLNQLSDSDYR